MAEQTGEFENSTAATPGDEAIRRFLLGGLGEDDQAKLEESLFGNGDPKDDFEARVRAAEYELADDYAFSRLSAVERELFEKNFLVTGDRKRKLAVSAALRNHLAAQAALAKPPRQRDGLSLRESIMGWLGFNRPVLGFAVAIVLLVLIGGAVWLALRNQRAKESILVRREPVVMATPENNHVVQPSPTPETGASPKPSPKASPTPPEPESTSIVATFLLLPNAVRDGGQMTRITLPKGQHAVVRLQLELEVAQPGSHSAELLTPEGVSIYSSARLKMNGANSTGQVVFDVPARLLKSGDYQVKLNWIVGGSVTSGGRYYFRVTQ